MGGTAPRRRGCRTPSREWRLIDADGAPHPAAGVVLGGMPRATETLGAHCTWAPREGFVGTLNKGTLLVIAKTSDGLRAFFAVVGRGSPPQHVRVAAAMAECVRAEATGVTPP